MGIDYEEQAMYYQMQGVIDDWAYRNGNRGIPESARGPGGGGSPHYSVGPSSAQVRYWQNNIKDNPLYGEDANKVGSWWNATL